MAPQPIKTRPRLNQNDLLADGLLSVVVERFRLYRNQHDRQRLLSGIDRDSKYDQMTVRDALIFICTFSATREWRRSHLRKARYNRARQLSQFIADPPSYLPTDVELARRQARATEANRVEALVALAFARRSGYETHSRTLWQSIERAIRSEAGYRDVDTLFASIRSRLNYQYSKPLSSRLAVQRDSETMFSLLSNSLRKAALGNADDYFLLNATHRDT